MVRLLGAALVAGGCAWLGFRRALELKDHPFFVGVQFHPEFKSRPDRAHPLFYGFVRAALETGTADK